MQPQLKLRGEGTVYGPLPLNAVHAFKGRRHNPHIKVRLSFRPCTRVTCMAGTIVNHVEFLW